MPMADLRVGAANRVGDDRARLAHRCENNLTFTHGTLARLRFDAITRLARAIFRHQAGDLEGIAKSTLAIAVADPCLTHMLANLEAVRHEVSPVYTFGKRRLPPRPSFASHRSSIVYELLL